MEKEFLKETERSVTLNVTGGKIDSFRELEKTSGTVRVYDNGFVGIAGSLGEPDETELTARAKDALSFAIPYPCTPYNAPKATYWWRWISAAKMQCPWITKSPIPSMWKASWLTSKRRAFRCPNRGRNSFGNSEKVSMNTG